MNPVLFLLLSIAPLALSQSLTCTCTTTGSRSTIKYIANPGRYESWLGLYTGAINPLGNAYYCPPYEYQSFISSANRYPTLTESLCYKNPGQYYTCALWEGKLNNCTRRIVYDTVWCPLATSIPTPTPRYTPPITPRTPDNSGLFLAIFLPIGIVLFIVIITFIIVCLARRARMQRVAQLTGYTAVPSTLTAPSAAGVPAVSQVYAPQPAAMLQPTFMSPMPIMATGVMPPPYVMSSPAQAAFSPLMYSNVGGSQPVFIATATNPAPPQ